MGANPAAGLRRRPRPELWGCQVMLFNAACEGCKPVPLTVAVTDHMLDIPPFLQRALHPELNEVKFHEAPSKSKPTPVDENQTGIDRHREHETDEDRRQRA